MVTKMHQLLEDVEFIFAECIRIQNLLKGGFDRIPKDDFFFSIPHPASGEILCGRAAARKLGGLAKEAGRRAGLLRRVELQTLIAPTAELIVQRFVRERRSLDIQQVDRALSAAAKMARQSCADIKHLVPCHLMLAKDPEELRIGPVVFRNRAAFRRLLLEKIRAYPYEDEKGNRDFVRSLVADSLRYYRTFNWVAEVDVKGCDKKTSTVIAGRAVTSALDCLHLILGARWTDRMRVGGPSIHRDIRANLSISASGDLNFEVSHSLAGLGQLNFEDGWSELLTTPYIKRSLELCGVALEAAVDPDLERPLSRRFLDAAQWFGEASRDDSASTRVVKYVTALERMVMTGEEAITSHISERVAALCLQMAMTADRETWRKKATTAYDLRSKLVHGSISPRAPKVERGVSLCAELGEATLLSAINAFGEKGLRDDAVSSKRLGRWFGELIGSADQVTLEEPKKEVVDSPPRPA